MVWHKPIRETLYEDPLIAQIIEHRNYIVHRSMLKPESKADMAAIRGYKIKMRIPFKVGLFEDSDEAVKRFLKIAEKNPVFLDILAPDETQVLAIIRKWHIKGFDDEIITVFRNAWLRMTKYLSDAIEFLGGERFSSDLPRCFKKPREHWYKKYHGQFLDPE